jgi:hypothetical protein
MLKTSIPVEAPSIWLEIKALRDSNLDHLAPLMKARSLAFLEDCKKVTIVNTERFDPIIFETRRPERLQEIYFQQGTTHAPTALYGWHFYGLAIDVISRSKEWDVRSSWWKLMADFMRRNSIDPGHDWLDPDDPHGQLHGLKKSPSDIARQLYFGTAKWAGMLPFTDPSEHQAGLERVWRAVGAM